VSAALTINREVLSSMSNSILCSSLHYRRLGYDDCQKILDNDFFAGFDLAGVMTGSFQPLYVPAQSFLTGINVSDTAGQFADPSSFFDTMSTKEEKRFVEIFKDKNFAQVK